VLLLVGGREDREEAGGGMGERARDRAPGQLAVALASDRLSLARVEVLYGRGRRYACHGSSREREGTFPKPPHPPQVLGRS
jgi:hypothetical protein